MPTYFAFPLSPLAQYFLMPPSFGRVNRIFRPFSSLDSLSLLNFSLSSGPSGLGLTEGLSPYLGLSKNSHMKSHNFTAIMYYTNIRHVDLTNTHYSTVIHLNFELKIKCWNGVWLSFHISSGESQPTTLKVNYFPSSVSHRAGEFQKKHNTTLFYLNVAIEVFPSE